MPAALTLAAGVSGLLLGPLLAAGTVRLADRDRAARPSRARVLVTSLLAALAVAAGAAWAGPRPAAVALAWFGAAAVVLAGVDLRCHRLPDRVVYPAVAVCAVALSADALVTGEWPALLRAGGAALVAAGLGTAARLLSPTALGRGDVKLLGLVGLLLGWAGWGVLLGGVLAGLLLGALGSLLLIAVGRAGWRTRVAFGPPLLLGTYVALALAGPLPGS